LAVTLSKGVAALRYDPDKHHRQSIRLKGFDYSTAGAYLITLCVQQRECLFGEVVQGSLQANHAGRMVERWWTELATKFSSLALDESIVMPNHLHGVLFLRETGAPRLGEVMDWFKTMTTNDYIRSVKTLGWRSFPGRLWQRGYFDRVIRNQEELERIRQYIHRNPLQWLQDSENPENPRTRQEKTPPPRAAT
jgi:REP element-mobilizing transposase RayT